LVNGGRCSSTKNIKEELRRKIMPWQKRDHRFFRYLAVISAVYIKPDNPEIFVSKSVSVKSV
jgi:hypothetical protein